MPPNLLSGNLSLAIDLHIEVSNGSLVTGLNDNTFGSLLGLFPDEILKCFPLLDDERIVLPVVIDLLLRFGLGHLELSTGEGFGDLSELPESATISESEDSCFAKVSEFGSEVLHRFVMVI